MSEPLYLVTDHEAGFSAVGVWSDVVAYAAHLAAALRTAGETDLGLGFGESIEAFLSDYDVWVDPIPTARDWPDQLPAVCF